MKLATKRLVLRKLEISDSNDLVEGLNNLNVTKWLFIVKFPYTLKDAKKWIEYSQLEFLKSKINSYNFGIELKKENKIIGGISLDIKDEYKANVGYWLNEMYWKKGFGQEALRKIVYFAFKKLNLQRLEAGVTKENISSRRLLERFGAKKEGVKRKSFRCYADKNIKDELIYGLLKEEYKK